MSRIVGWRTYGGLVGQPLKLLGEWEVNNNKLDMDIAIKVFKAPEGTSLQSVPHYSTDPTQAVKVIEAMRGKGGDFYCDSKKTEKADLGRIESLEQRITILKEELAVLKGQKEGYMFHCSFKCFNEVAVSESFPEAVCKAALAVINE
jgi:hypothetical protein